MGLTWTYKDEDGDGRIIVRAKCDECGAEYAIKWPNATDLQPWEHVLTVDEIRQEYETGEGRIEWMCPHEAGNALCQPGETPAEADARQRETNRRAAEYRSQKAAAGAAEGSDR